MNETYFTVDRKPIRQGDLLWCLDWKRTGIVTREIAGVRSIKVVGDESDYVRPWADRDEAIEVCLRMLNAEVDRCRQALDAAIADRARVTEALEREVS